MFENIYKKVEENKEIKFIPYDMYNETIICGRSIEEIITILTALDLEKETGIKVTMENLSRIIKLYQEEQKDSANKAIRIIRGGTNK